jgi:hypothetical protein
MTRIRITIGTTVVAGTLDDSATAAALAKALPISARAHRWGDEIYFDTPVVAPPERPQAAVPSGTIAYWPPGRALCLFFGQTPYSPVNVVGTIDGDARVLAATKDGETATVEAGPQPRNP